MYPKGNDPVVYKYVIGARCIRKTSLTSNFTEN